MNIYLCSKHFFPSTALISLFLFAMSWHYSLGCLICGNTHETPVSMLCVTTANVYKTITGYLQFILHLLLLCQVDVAWVEIPPCYKTGTHATCYVSTLSISKHDSMVK